jgi:hypothetical protein
LILAEGLVGEFIIFSPPRGHHSAVVMVLVKFHQEIGIESLLWVSKLVVLLDLHQKENFDTSTIFIID